MSARSRLTPLIAAPTLRARSAGEPLDDRTLMLTEAGAGCLLSSNCATGMYIVGGTGSPSAPDTASATGPASSRGGWGVVRRRIGGVWPAGVAPVRNILAEAALT